MANVTPWAQIQGSLPPLTAPPQEQKPPATMVFAPIHAPTMHEAPDMAPLSGMPQPSPRQAVFAPVPGSLADEQQHIQGQLGKDYAKDLHPWGTPENHPGVWGKIGHAVSYATGGPGRRQMEEAGLENHLEKLGQEQSAEGLQGAQGKNLESEVPLHEAQTKAAQLVEITPDMATAMGNPGLAGQQVSQGVLQHLETTAGTNKTKTDISNAGNATRLSVTQLQDASREAVAQGKPQPHIITMQSGSPHVMERDPATGAYKIDRGEAPPNYAQVLPEMLDTKTTELLGPDGVQHRYQYNPQTQAFDKDMGAAPTGTAAHQIFQGAAIEQLAPQIISDIQANRDILGNLGSYYKQWLAGTPVSDPHAAQLMTELMSFAAMQPALHGFRSTNALEAFEKMIGGLTKNPDSTIATIQGLLKTPEAFTNLPQQSKTNSKSAPSTKESSLGKTSKPDGVYEMNGKHYRVEGGNVYAQ